MPKKCFNCWSKSGGQEVHTETWLRPSQLQGGPKINQRQQVFMIKPNLHGRRRRDAIVELSRVGDVYTEFATSWRQFRRV